MVMEGKLKEAAHLLGRSFFLEGIVIRGDSRGKKLGFPTANLAVEPNILLPLGVFVVAVYIGKKKYYGMANIGFRPSFSSGKNNPQVEVHIFDFHKNLYGKKIGLEFIAKVRDEKVFESVQGLVEQIKKDEQYVRKIFRKK
jgi:riboflavin kinase/FMN adenylyltransferase